MPKNNKTISAPELLDRNYGAPKSIVSNTLTEGLTILAGAPKIGKSWMAMELCLAVAEGRKFLGEETTPGTVLYMALEDSPLRTQNRLMEFTEYPPEKLHFQHMGNSIGEGFEPDVSSFAADHPDFVLLVVDTLQMVRRDAGKKEGYANDYNELKVLKTLADRHHIAILVIHHTRKQGDDDPLNRVSGSTGINGVADGTMVLTRVDRENSKKATLFCTGRDISERTFELEFDEQTKNWNVLSDSGRPPACKLPEPLMAVLVYWLRQIGSADISASSLQEYFIRTVGECNCKPSQLSKMVMGSAGELARYGISVCRIRTGTSRFLRFRYNAAEDTHPDQ